MLKTTLTFVRHNTIALLALFIAIGGTSYAAISLPAKSVGTKQLRNHAVTSRKLARHAVTARSLDPKSIAGHVADWAIVRNGQVAASSPRASAESSNPSQGPIRVSWHRAIPDRCVAIANPANGHSFPAALTADTAGPLGVGAATSYAVEILPAGGGSVSQDFNLVIICP